MNIKGEFLFKDDGENLGLKDEVNEKRGAVAE